MCERLSLTTKKRRHLLLLTSRQPVTMFYDLNMNSPRAVLLLLIVCSFSVRLSAKTVQVGDGIEVQIVGKGGEQRVQIIRDGRKIYETKKGDGNISKVIFIKSADGNRYNIATRFGTDSDLWRAFAVIGDKVIASPVYRNTARHDNNVPASWTSPDRLEIGKGGKQPNALSFDPTLNKWTLARKNAGPSHWGGSGLYPSDNDDNKRSNGQGGEDASRYITFRQQGSGELMQTVAYNSHPSRVIVLNYRSTPRNPGGPVPPSGQYSVIVPPKGSAVVGWSSGGPELALEKIFYQ
jgi:hypothetical protein